MKTEKQVIEEFMVEADKLDQLVEHQQFIIACQTVRPWIMRGIRAELRKSQMLKSRTRRASVLICRRRFRDVLIGMMSDESTVGFVGCTLAQLKWYLESKFQPGMTWHNRGTFGWHIDHVRPCASFDLSDPEQQRKCFHYSNLQPLWALDNIKKGAKV